MIPSCLEVDPPTAMSTRAWACKLGEAPRFFKVLHWIAGNRLPVIGRHGRGSVHPGRAWAVGATGAAAGAVGAGSSTPGPDAGSVPGVFAPVRADTTPLAAMSARPTKVQKSGAWENTSQPAIVAKASCRYKKGASCETGADRYATIRNWWPAMPRAHTSNNRVQFAPGSACHAKGSPSEVTTVPTAPVSNCVVPASSL